MYNESLFDRSSRFVLILTAMIPKAIGENISLARTGARLTQIEMAGRLGVTQAAVSGWETGRRVPSVYMLARVAAVLGVSVDALLTPAAA